MNNISLIEITDDTDLPRINYTNFDYENGEVVPYSGTGSLLLEPQSTNLLPYSEDLTQWSNNNSVTLTNGQLAPDGTLGATKVSGIIGSSSIYNYASSSETATRSIYARTVSGTGTARLMSYFGNTNNLFTLTEQWQRFELTNSIVPGGGNFYIDFRDNSQTLSEFIIWGAQSEEIPYATSLIPTNGSTVTRLADVCNNAGSSDLINSTEGVLYAEVSALASGTGYRVISISDGSTSNVVRFYYSPTPNRIGVNLRSNSADVFSIANLNITNDLEYIKIAISYKLNDFKIYINGTQVQSYTSGSVPIGLNELAFDNGAGNDKFNGNVKTVAVFDYLDNDQLERLTGEGYESFNLLAQANNYTII
jgi:hypothetical protein